MYKASSLSKIQSANDKVSNSVEILSDISVKQNFHSTLSFWTNKSNACDVNASVHLIGKRHGFGIVNVEHHVDMLKTASSCLKGLGRVRGSLLLGDDELNQFADALLHSLALTSVQAYPLEKW